MLKVQKNKRNDLYTASQQNFKKSLSNHFEKSPGEVMIYDLTFQFWSGERMLVKKLDVNALLPMLCRFRFSKSFQSDNYFYCDLNNSTLDFFIWIYRNRF